MADNAEDVDLDREQGEEAARALEEGRDAELEAWANAYDDGAVPTSEVIDSFDVGEPVRGDEAPTAEGYLDLVERHRKQALLRGNEREAGLLDERVEYARRLFEDPMEVGRLASVRPESMDMLDADRVRAENPAEAMPSFADLRRLMFGPESVEREMSESEQRTLTDPVRGYVHAAQRYRAMVLADEVPEQVHQINIYQRQRAQAVAADPQSLLRFGAEHPEMARQLAGDAGIARDAEANETGMELARAYVGADDQVRESLGEEGFTPEYERLRTDRGRIAGQMRENPAALLYVGMIAAEKDRKLSGKVASDLDSRSLREGSAERKAELKDEYAAFRDRFAAGLGEAANDPVKLYAAVNLALYRCERTGDQASKILFLDRMSRESAGALYRGKDGGARLAEVAAKHPALKDKLMRELAAGRSAERGGQDAAAAGSDPGDGDSSPEKEKAPAEEAPAEGGKRLSRQFEEALILRRRDLTRYFNTGPEEKAFALPLNAFGGASGAIDKMLEQTDGETLSAMYDRTVALRDKLGSMPDLARKESGKIAFDNLEMGRRALSVWLVHKGVRQPEETVKDAQKFRSEKSRKLADEYRRDPGGAIRDGDEARRIKFLKAVKKHGVENARKSASVGRKVVGDAARSVMRQCEGVIDQVV